jgi:hypothetical protein
MVHPASLVVIPLIAIVGFSDNALAQGFLKKIGKVVTAPITAPAKQIGEAVKVVRGKQSVGDAAKNVVRHQAAPVRATGAVTQDVARTAGRVHQAGHNAVNGAARRVAGPLGERVVDTLTASHRFHGEIATTGAGAAGRFAESGRIADLNPLAVTLAAAIRSAREQHIQNAKPIPAHVQQHLSRVFAPAVLQRARYVVGDGRLSLPAVTNRIQTIRGGGHAVVVDDVIVFSRDPGMDMWWWGHEMTHVGQYALLGVDRFAQRYVTNHSMLEAEADHLGNRVVASQAPQFAAPRTAGGPPPRFF